MNKFFLIMNLSLSFSFVCAETFDEIYKRISSKKRFTNLEAFEAELEKYDLTEIDKECIKGKVEACFILEKLEKELTTFINAAENIERLHKEQQTPLTFDNFPKFLDNYFPGLSNSFKEHAIKMRTESLQKAKEREMNKLRKMECKTTADVEGMKRYLECGKKKIARKYKRLQEKYPNNPNQSEKSWLFYVRHHKVMCTKYGNTDSCVGLQRMRKK